MKRWFVKLCSAAVSALAMVLVCGMSVSAKEITVSGQDIQAALNEAENTDENVTVIIPAGTYNLSDSLLVYSNTTIQADGADITVSGSKPVLTHSPYISPVNIAVSGGTWRGDGEQIICFKGNPQSSNLQLDNMTICGNSDSIGIHLQDVANSKVSNCKINGLRIGINLFYCSKVECSQNSIENSAETGICAVQVSELTILNNTINQSGKYGIWFDWDKASTIKGNNLDGCAVDHSRADHGEGLVVQHGEGTWIQNNTISNVHSYMANYGNGVIVSLSQSITVDGNTVNYAGNHGLQASYSSANVHFRNNVVNHSGKMGISVSRATSADMTGNIVNDSTVSGIVYDGKEGTVSGTVTDCTIDGSKAEGMHLESANVTVNNTTVKNSTGMGVVVLGSTVSIADSVICQDAVDGSGYGIVTNNGAKVSLDGNRICNFGNSGIVLNSGCTMTGTNNQIMVNTNKFNSNGIYTASGNAEKIMNNTLIIKDISNTEVTGQTYYADFACGVVVNGIKYASQTDSTGKFTISYPQTDNSKVIVYVTDNAGNSICLQAPVDFNLNGVQNGTGDSDTKLVEDFVKRMYRITLDREADASGLEFYVTRLQNGEMDGSSVAQGFVGSPEFQGKQLSQEDYLDALYRAFFDRTPGASEIQYWKDEMASGKSRKYVLRGFVNSPEFERLCQAAGITRGMMVLAENEEYEVNTEGIGEFVERLYVKALGRASEPEGKQYWIDGISSRTVTAEEAAKKFFFSPEFVGFNTSDAEYIERLYLTFMDRASEPDGKAYWINEMNNGMTRETVLSRFAASEEFQSIMKRYGIF